jgi:hypothetical protein
VVRRARLKAPRQLVAGGSHFDRGELFEQGSPPPEHPKVRAEELVGRAGEKIDAQHADVERHMGRGVNGVDEEQRAHRVSDLGDSLDRIDRSDCVRRQPDRDEASARPELAREPLEVQRAVVPPDVDPAEDGSALLPEREPGRDVRVVVEPCDDDLVP